MSSTLALAAQLVALERPLLLALLKARAVQKPAAIRDALDLAAQLLQPASITRTLRTLRTAELYALLTNFRGQDQPARDTCQGLGLLDDSGTPFPEVRETVQALVAATPAAAAILSADPAAPKQNMPRPAATVPQQVTPEHMQLVFAEAFSSTAQCTWLLRDLANYPARINRNGQIAAKYFKQLPERLPVPEAEILLRLLRACGLLVVQAGQLLPARATAWFTFSIGERWLRLATAAAAQLPSQLRPPSQPGISVSAHLQELPRQFPLLSAAALQDAAATTALWDRLGITWQGILTGAGAQILDGSLELAAVEAYFPAPASGVYIQPDLSVIVPGALPAAAEAALAALTVPEQVGVAQTLRITEATLQRALRRNISAAQIRATLQGLALNELPQPLCYLLDAHSAAVPAASSANSGGAEVPDADPAANCSDDPLQDLVERVLHPAAGCDITRQLTLAQRNRSAVMLRVSLRGAERDFTVVPLALRDERVRTLDQRAGVERTFPLNAITRVVPPPADS